MVARVPIERLPVSSVVLAAALLLSAPAVAQTISAVDVVRLASSQSPLAVAARAAVGVAEARRAATGRYPNPSFSWNRGHFLGDNGEREDALFLSFPIDLSSRRSTARLLVQAGIAAAQATALRQQSAAVVRSLELFYQLAAERRREQIQVRTVRQLGEAARVVKRRRDEGRASGYDQTRLEIAAELAISALQQTRARQRRLHARLASLLDLDARRVVFAAALAPESSVRAAKDGARPERPSLRLMRSAGGHAAKARDASARSWLPLFSVSGGLRFGDEQGERYGYVAGVNLNLPLFSAGQGLRASAQARVRSALAQAGAADRVARLDIARAGKRLESARVELKRFRRATEGRVERLRRAAVSGYREGRLTIVELLDAQRARTAVENRVLELEWWGKRSEIALRAARGEFE